MVLVSEGACTQCVHTYSQIQTHTYNTYNWKIIKNHSPYAWHLHVCTHISVHMNMHTCVHTMSKTNFLHFHIVYIELKAWKSLGFLEKKMCEKFPYWKLWSFICILFCSIYAYIYLFWDRVSVCHPWWPWTSSDPPASVSQKLYMPGWFVLGLYNGNKYNVIFKFFGKWGRNLILRYR